MGIAHFGRFRARAQASHATLAPSGTQPPAPGLDATPPLHPYDTLTDEALLAKVAHDDDEALRHLYRRYSGLVYSLAFHMLSDRTQAEEILQETIIRVWRAAGSFDAKRGSPEAWIVTIARNLAVSALRRERPLSLEHAGEWALPLTEDADEPDAVTWRHTQRDLVRAAVAMLPLAQRSVVYLAYFAGMTHAEIAERTGEPLGTVKSRLRLALRRLQALLHTTLGPGAVDSPEIRVAHRAEVGLRADESGEDLARDVERIVPNPHDAPATAASYPTRPLEPVLSSPKHIIPPGAARASADQGGPATSPV